jgi:hypothetical protein
MGWSLLYEDAKPTRIYLCLYSITFTGLVMVTFEPSIGAVVDTIKALLPKGGERSLKLLCPTMIFLDLLEPTSKRG